MSVFMQPIYTQTVGAGGAAYIAFNNIPQGFTDLKLVMSLRGTATGSLAGGFIDGSYVATNNNITKQSWTFLYGGSAGPQSARGRNSIPYIGPINGAGTTTSTFSNCEVYIANYSNGTFKALGVDVAAENNSSTNYFVSQLSLLSRNTEPVTSIQVYTGEGAWAQHSTFTLYGISNVYDTQIPTAPTIGTVTDQSGFASVAFTPAANDQADSYVVTSTPSGSTTYGVSSPIVTPATLGTSYTYNVSAVNSLGSSSSSPSNTSITENSFSSIATVSLSTASTPITFNNIPSNYTNLRLVLFGRGTNAATSGYGFMQINGSAATASSNYMLGNGTSSSMAGYPNSSQPLTFNLTAANATSGIFGVAIFEILDYASFSKTKVTRINAGWDNNGSGASQQWGHLFNDLGPVTSISLHAWDLSTFAQYTHAALYGIG